HASRSHLAPRVKHTEDDLPRVSQIPPLFHQKVMLCPTRHLLNPKRRFSVAIGNKRDFLAVRRPARIDVVEVTIGKRESISALRWHHPELMPCPAKIRGINDPLPIR